MVEFPTYSNDASFGSTRDTFFSVCSRCQSRALFPDPVRPRITHCAESMLAKDETSGRSTKHSLRFSWSCSAASAPTDSPARSRSLVFFPAMRCSRWQTNRFYDLTRMDQLGDQQGSGPSYPQTARVLQSRAAGDDVCGGDVARSSELGVRGGMVLGTKPEDDKPSLLLTPALSPRARRGRYPRRAHNSAATLIPGGLGLWQTSRVLARDGMPLAAVGVARRRRTGREAAC